MLQRNGARIGAECGYKQIFYFVCVFTEFVTHFLPFCLCSFLAVSHVGS